MASYIVLARKWRPQTFADLVGQQHIAVTLRNAIAQNRVAHAFLFTGSRGVGKTSTARIFAKALNCEHAPCDEPCNECVSCREITEGHSMDVIEIDGASNRGINEIREVLDAVRYAPSRDRYKIYIIDEVHMLTTEAFNALLKTLEEPPAHVVFIFATTDPNKIPITIVSRCQRYDFKRISEDDLAGHLGHIAESEGIRFEDSALRLIARTARGGVRDALSAMDQIIAFAEQPVTGERAAEVLGVASRETLMKMGESIIRQDVDGALACIEKVDHYGQNLSQFAFDLLEFWRDVTVLAASPNAPVELNASEKEKVRELLPLAGFDRLQRLFQIWYQTSETLPKSLSPRLVMEMASIKMCRVENVVPLDGILRRMDSLAKAICGSAPMAPGALEHVQAYLKEQGIVFPVEKKNNELRNVEEKTSGDAASDKMSSSPSNGKGSFGNHSSSDGAVLTSSERSSDRGKAFGEAGTHDSKSSVSTSMSVVGAVGSEDGLSSSLAEKDRGTVSVKSEDSNAFMWETDAASGSSEYSEESWNEYAEAGDSSEDDEDGDDEMEAKSAECKKTLEVSANRLKTSPPGIGAEKDELDDTLRWKRIVVMVGNPLSSMLMRARLDCFTRNSLEVTLPLAFQGMISEHHIREVDGILARHVGRSCRFSVRYDDIGDGTETLAAQEAKTQLEAEKKEFERVREHPVMKRIIEVFHVNPDEIRFTINPDRTFNEQGH